MAWQYREFETEETIIRVPLASPQQDHSPMPTKPRYAETADGAVDVLGEEDSDLEGQQTHTFTGVYYGETTYLVDEQGNRFVDHLGRYIIFGDPPQMLRKQIVSLRKVYRKVGKLWRENVELDGRRQWKRAVFSEMGQPQISEDRKLKATITCGFTTTMPYWHKEQVKEVTGQNASNTPLLLLVENGSNVTIEDAKLTITQSAFTVTDVVITCPELGVDLSWSGTLGPNEALVLDAGHEKIPDDAVGAFGGFTYGLAHTAASELPIPPGTWAYYLIIQGGIADVTLSFYEQEV